LYKVETLDTRFAGSGQALPTAQPSKWASRLSMGEEAAAEAEAEAEEEEED
jgi:hypothetical protein